MKLFENLPSTNTPINAENLNQIQDNLVIVSKTEPTGDNREKVWIQKGKNLFDKNSLFTGYRFGSDGSLFADSAYSSTDYISVKSNTIYTVNWQMETRECVCYYDETKTFISRNTATSPFTTPTNCKYIRASRISTGINTAQIEQGSTATEYEEYIEPKIYVKNDNDVYEEFSSKEDTLERYATKERVVGVWIDGKPIYRKVFSFKTSDNCDIDFKHNLSDLDKIWINEGKSFVFTDEEAKRETLVLNWYHDANTFTRCWINPWSIRFKAPFAFGVRTAYVTVEYTKTTS